MDCHDDEDFAARAASENAVDYVVRVTGLTRDQVVSVAMAMTEWRAANPDEFVPLKRHFDAHHQEQP